MWSRAVEGGTVNVTGAARQVYLASGVILTTELGQVRGWRCTFTAVAGESLGLDLPS